MTERALELLSAMVHSSRVTGHRDAGVRLGRQLAEADVALAGRVAEVLHDGVVA